MSRPATITGDQLANALQALGVNFIVSSGGSDESLHNQPARLIAALAGSDEARLRLALIPLFLEHPEFSEHVCTVEQNLDMPAQLTLQCYYSAAVWLQQLHRPRLERLIGKKRPLPDYFSGELGLQTTPDPEKNLGLLANCHHALTGAQVNWLGTYQHAAQVWLKGLEIVQVVE